MKTQNKNVAFNQRYAKEAIRIATDKSMTLEQKKTSMAELMWLNYFNQTLYEKGMITEEERNRLKLSIDRRKPTPKSR